MAVPDLLVDLPGVDPILAGRVLAFARPALRWLSRYIEPDCCIAATRLALCVLRDRLHMKVQALPIIASAANAVFVRLMTDEGPLNPEAQARWAQQGAWVVILGQPDQEQAPGRWPGHLAALVNDTILIDLSAHQVSRPEKGVLVSPYVISVPQGFTQGNLFGRRDLPEGGLLQIEIAQGVTGWQQAPDWQRVKRYEHGITYILDEMKATLSLHTKKRH